MSRWRGLAAVGTLRLMPRSASNRGGGRHRFLACDVIEGGRQIARAQFGDERVDAHSGYNMVCQSSMVTPSLSTVSATTALSDRGDTDAPNSHCRGRLNSLRG